MLFYNTNINLRTIFFEHGFVVGHRNNCSTRLLSPYYAGFDTLTRHTYFSFNELIFSLCAIRNFLIELSRNIYKESVSFDVSRTPFNFILVFSDRTFAAVFTFIFFILSKGSNLYYNLFNKRNRSIELGLFKFYIMARPLIGFITNCSSIYGDPGFEKLKGMPPVLDYDKTIFFSFGDYTLLNVLKSARANLHSLVIGVTDSNQFKVTDSYDYPVVGNDESFKFFAFIIFIFLKSIFRQATLQSV